MNRFNRDKDEELWNLECQIVQGEGVDFAMQVWTSRGDWIDPENIQKIENLFIQDNLDITAFTDDITFPKMSNSQLSYTASLWPPPPPSACIR